MTRTNSIPTLVLTMLAAAVAAAPAAAADAYRSPDSVLAVSRAQATTVSNDVGAAKQLFAGSTGVDSSSVTGSGLPTPDTYLVQSGNPLSSIGEPRVVSSSVAPTS